MRNTVIYLMGPTASGKTEIAIQLYKKLPIEIISVDSAQIYKEMNIGTNKPSLEILQKIPHHLINIIDPNQKFSVSKFYHKANNLINIIHSKGKIPFFVGGTMLYFKSMFSGLSNLPPENIEIREKINIKAKKYGWGKLHEELLEIDYNFASKIAKNDTQRIQRGLEVFYESNKPLSSFHKEKNQFKSPFNNINLAITAENRNNLYFDIEIRFKKMLSNGFLDEVDYILKKFQLTPDLPSSRCVGYRQAINYLNNKINFIDFLNHSIYSTRQLAKRQMTWIRSFKNLNIFCYDTEKLSSKIFELLKKKLEY